MNESEARHTFEEYIEDIQDILTNINELFEFDVEDDELSLLGEEFKANIQNVIDSDVPNILDVIDNLMVDK